MPDHYIAVTRAVPASINRCELTYLSRAPIDLARARLQHAEYQRALADLGCEVVELPEAADLPDSAFVEDAALVFDECAVIARPGALSRREETASVRDFLATYRTLREIVAPGTLDGGDVVRIGRRVFAGLSTRTNEEAIRQLGLLLQPFGYDVVAVRTQGCLHLKSAASAIADDLVVVDTDAVDPRVFGTAYLEVPAHAANMLRVNDTILCPAAAAATAARLRAAGLRVRLIDNSELARAEAGLTCCSIVLRP